MKRSAALFALAFFYLLIMPHEAFAQRGGRSQEIKLDSPLPGNSDWGRSLDRIAAEWARVTNNEVILRINHQAGGSDAKMLSSLSTNTIQAALFSSFGLTEICPAVMTLSVPFQIKNDTELDLVLSNVLPVLDAQISKTRFAVIAWSKGSWVNVFSREPVFVPDDLRRHRIATSPESENLNTAFKTMGFHMVETEMGDLTTRLAGNVITAFYQTPAAVAPFWLNYKDLGINMLDIPIAPFVGAIVINRVTWDRLSPDRQRELARVTQRIVSEFDSRMPRLVDNAITAMNRDGLTVNRANPAQEELWRAELNKAIPSLLGTTFDRDLYQRISEILEKARNGQ